jgi:hypothetical protein
VRSGSIVRLAFPIPRLGVAFGFGDGCESRAFDVVHTGATDLNSVRARALPLLDNVFETRRVVVFVAVMLGLPRSATTKVKAQEFARHA